MSYLSVGVENNSDTSLPLNDCPIYSLNISVYDNENIDVTIANVKLREDTEKSLIDRFGQPSEITRMDSITSIRWETEDWDEFSVTLDNDTGTAYEVSTHIYL